MDLNMYFGRIFMTSYNLSIIAAVYEAQVLPRITSLFIQISEPDSNLSLDGACGLFSDSILSVKLYRFPPFIKTVVLENQK